MSVNKFCAVLFFHCMCVSVLPSPEGVVTSQPRVWRLQIFLNTEVDLLMLYL